MWSRRYSTTLTSAGRGGGGAWASATTGAANARAVSRARIGRRTSWLGILSSRVGYGPTPQEPMKDMTKGPVTGHVLQLAGFIALTMLFQTLYFLADLYFVGRLGKEAVAGVSLSGNLAFVVLALTQSLGVGATALVAQALGRRQREQAELVFNQAFVLSTLTGLAFGLLAFAGRGAYCGRLAADAATAEQGIRYLTWFVPALATQFPLVAMSATLRGMGDLKVPTAIQVATVLLNVVLAPVLIFGWLGAPALGVQGAALASLAAIAAGSLALALYFRRAESPFRFRLPQWRPQPRLWGSLLRI